MPMAYDRTDAPPSGTHDNEYIDSIVDVIEKEMSGAGMNPDAQEPPDEAELLVADLLRFLEVDPIEDVIDSEF
jgi:hypothetical protein